MQSRLYSTEYSHAGSTYTCFLYASSDKAAVKVAKYRGINEKILGAYRLADTPSWKQLYRKRKGPVLVERMHYLAFLAFVSVRSGYHSVDEVLGDKGWFHEYLHGLQFPGEPLNVSRTDLDEIIFKTERALAFTPHE